jgi:Uma2 family endonuclease
MAAQHPSLLEEGTLPLSGTTVAHEESSRIYVPESLYWAKYYEYAGESDVSYEWNNGYLEELPVTDLAEFRTYQWFVSLLRDFLYVNPIALMIGLEMGFRMALGNKVVIRKPDLGVVLNSNPVTLKEHDRSYRGIFDLCVESLSDGDQRDIDRDVIEKFEEYAAGGVQEYYILDDGGAATRFYRLTQRGVYEPLPITNGVVRSLVLPGFQLRVADLYVRPWLAQLADDPVYSSFASPDFRAERLRAEQAEQRAGQERQRAEQAEERAAQERNRAEQAEERAEQERNRAERYAEMLRTAGLLPPG